VESAPLSSTFVYFRRDINSALSLWGRGRRPVRFINLMNVPTLPTRERNIGYTAALYRQRRGVEMLATRARDYRPLRSRICCCRQLRINRDRHSTAAVSFFSFSRSRCHRSIDRASRIFADVSDSEGKTISKYQSRPFLFSGRHRPRRTAENLSDRERTRN